MLPRNRFRLACSAHLNQEETQLKSISSISVLALAAAFSSPAAAQDGRAATIAARSHFFGVSNVDQRTGAVDKEKVIISYFSVQSFAVAARGRVFLLDSYIYRVSDTPGYVPTTVQELVDLKPEAIFIGHGHGDHADNAAYIAVKTGATIFGAAEHCDAMRGDAQRIFGAGTPVNCNSLTTIGAVPGSEVSDVRVMRPDICITAFKHLHSGAAPLDPTFPVIPINPVRDSRVSDLYPTQPPPTLNTRTVAGAGGAVSMFYQFTVGDFSFIWHDTNGPIRAFQPQLVPLIAGLPKADVEFGSLVSIGETTNGTYDIALYIQLVKPKIFFGGHADNFNIGASPYYHRALRKQLEVFGVTPAEQPDVAGFDDPYDYISPGLATFAWKDKRWREVPAGKTAMRCEGSS
jgi:hypothetical protein